MQNRRQVLYEVVRKGQEKIAEGIKTGRFNSAKQGKSSFTEDDSEKLINMISAWPSRKAKQAYLNSRLIISIPYRVAGVILLAFVLVVLLAFWLGQIRGQNRRIPPLDGRTAAVAQENNLTKPEEPVGRTDEFDVYAVAGADSKVEVLAPAGNHVIVIATVKETEDLEAVRKYFAANGIETEIEQRSSFCFLITKDKFQSPKKEESDINRVLSRIKKIGLRYEPPAGSKGFGAEPFQDAYPMKIE